MRFAYPYYLFLLLLIPFFVWYLFYRKKKDNSFIKYPHIDIIKSFLRKKPSLPYNMILNIIRLIVFVLLIIVIARPQAGQKSEEVLTRGYDIMLCIDTSSSMRAEDFKPKNRLEVAKSVVEDFIKARKNDRIGLVVFSGIAFTQCPLTLDHGALLDFLKSVEIGITQTDGTAIGTALITASNRLKKSNAKSKIIILLTDGRNNMGQIDPITAAKTAGAVGIKIYTIGAGVPGGALIPVDHPIFGRQYRKIAEDLDEDTLRKIALQTEGRYFRATSEKGLKQIYKQIDEMEKTEIKVKEYTKYSELFRWFLIPAILLLLLEFILRYIIWRKIP
ncbi:VWA domain-containing protein [bacterium]